MNKNEDKEKRKKIIKRITDIVFGVCMAVLGIILIVGWCLRWGGGNEQANAAVDENGEQIIDESTVPDLRMPMWTKGRSMNTKVEWAGVSMPLTNLPNNSPIVISYFKTRTTDSSRIYTIQITALQTYEYEDGSTYWAMRGHDRTGTSVFYIRINKFDNSIVYLVVGEEEFTPVTGGLWLDYINPVYANSSSEGEGVEANLVKAYKGFWAQVDKTNINTFYNSGFVKGEQSKNNISYGEGYSAGYNQGYADYSGKTFSPISMIVKPVAEMFSIKLFGDFAIGDFFTVALFVTTAIMFLKIFAGG